MDKNQEAERPKINKSVQNSGIKSIGDRGWSGREPWIFISNH